MGLAKQKRTRKQALSMIRNKAKQKAPTRPKQK